MSEPDPGVKARGATSRSRASALLAVAAACAGVLTLLIFIVAEIGGVLVPKWLCALVVAAGLAAILRLRAPWKQPVRVLTSVVLLFLGFVAGADTSRTRFLRDLYSIRPGMTPDQVRRIMAGYNEGTGWPPNLLVDRVEPSGEFTVPGAIVFRHSDEPQYNSDWGVVSFKNGRVTQVRFDPD